MPKPGKKIPPDKARQVHKGEPSYDLGWLQWFQEALGDLRLPIDGASAKLPDEPPVPRQDSTEEADYSDEQVHLQDPADAWQVLMGIEQFLELVAFTEGYADPEDIEELGGYYQKLHGLLMSYLRYEKRAPQLRALEEALPKDPGFLRKLRPHRWGRWRCEWRPALRAAVVSLEKRHKWSKTRPPELSPVTAKFVNRAFRCAYQAYDKSCYDYLCMIHHNSQFRTADERDRQGDRQIADPEPRSARQWANFAQDLRRIAAEMKASLSKSGATPREEQCTIEYIEHLAEWASTAAQSVARATSETLPETAHTPGFRSAVWCGQQYTFTPIQARCIEVLWRAREEGIRAVSGKEILDQVETEHVRLVDVFKKHPAWQKMVVSGSRKGTYQLADRQP